MGEAFPFLFLVHHSPEMVLAEERGRPAQLSLQRSRNGALTGTGVTTEDNEHVSTVTEGGPMRVFLPGCMGSLASR